MNYSEKLTIHSVDMSTHKTPRDEQPNQLVMIFNWHSLLTYCVKFTPKQIMVMVRDKIIRFGSKLQNAITRPKATRTLTNPANID